MLSKTKKYARVDWYRGNALIILKRVLYSSQVTQSGSVSMIKKVIGNRQSESSQNKSYRRYSTDLETLTKKW